MDDLTKAEVVAAVSNDPVTAVMLGERKIELAHLGYDDYVKFLLLISPFFEGVSRNGLASPTQLILDVATELPVLAVLALKHSYPDITIEQVKNDYDPFDLAALVLKQAEVNKMVVKFKDFFALLLEMLGQANNPSPSQK